MQISNGAGGVVSNAGVDAENRLLTYATSRPEALQYNLKGQAYVVPIAVTPGSAGNVFFFLGSNTSSRSVVVDLINLVGSTETIDVCIGSWSSPVVTGDTGAAPVKKQVSGSNSCEWSASVGTSISISPAHTVIDSFRVPGYYVTSSSIVVPPGYALSLKAVSGSVALKGAVHFYLLDGTTMGSWSE